MEQDLVYRLLLLLGVRVLNTDKMSPQDPRTRTAAKEPGKALPPLPGLGHDKLPLERWLNKKKRQLQGKNSDKTKDT